MKIHKLLGAVTTLAFSAAMAFCQATSGNLTGAVKDSTGATVPHTAITVTSQTTGSVSTTTSNDSGQYLLQNLPAGTYDLRATATGFAPISIRGVTV